MANCTYTIDGKEIKGVEGLKAWLVDGGLESLYPDGSWVQAKEPESSTKPYEEKAKEYKEQEKGALPEEQARLQMEWRYLGQKDGTKTHALFFYETQADFESKSHGMRYVDIVSFDNGKWQIEGDSFASLADAKKAAIDIAITKAKDDGFVAKASGSKTEPKYSKGKSSGSTVDQVKSWLPRNVRKMLDAGKLRVVQSVDDLPANLRGVGDALFHTVFHGTPHDFDRFSLDKIGTGEGAQAFGYGLYFTDAKRIAEWYRDKLSNNYILEQVGDSRYIRIKGRWMNNDTNEWAKPDIDLALDFIHYFSSDKNKAIKEAKLSIDNEKRFSGKKTIDTEDIHIGQSFYTEQEVLSAIKVLETSYKGKTKEGKLYQVELAPAQDEYLDWDKPLSKQSENIRSALDGDKNRDNLNATKGKGRDLYVRLSRLEGDDKAASSYLHSLGIRGIRYKAEGGKSDAYNYVIFNDEDVSISAKYSRLSGIQGLYDNKSDTVYLVADMLDKGNLKAVLSHELYHRGLATDKKLQDAHNRFMGDMQRRYDMAAKGIGSKADKEAYTRVQAAETPAKDRLEEFAAYQISAWQQNPESISGAVKKAIQDFIAAIRAFLVRSGLDFGYIQSLTAADLAALSKYGAKVGEYTEGLQGSPAISYSLAPEQDTPSWRRWFGKSKMVSKGEPIKFYHGSKAQFTVFDKSKLATNTSHSTAGLGHFFTRDMGEARQYGGDVYEVFLSIQNPYVTTPDLLDKNMGADAAKFREKLQRQGYDGIYIKEANYAIAFESNQAKLTSNKSPSFGEDIRYSVANKKIPQPTFEEFKKGVETGKLNPATGVNYKQEDSAINPIEMGILNGYAIEDIEHFYARRRGYPQLKDNTQYSPIKEGYEQFIIDLTETNTRIDSGEFTPNAISKLSAKAGARQTTNTIDYSEFNPDIRYSIGSTVGASPKLKDSILYNLQDRFIDLKNQIEKVVKNGGTISEDSNPYMAEELYHQRTASRIKEFYDKELNPLLKKLHDSGIGLDRFQEFLHARHAPSRNAVMAERNPNQAIIDAKLKDAEESLEAVRNNPASTRKELSEALAEYNKWRRAKPFDGTEEERLSLSGMSNQEARDFLNGLTREEKAVLEPLGDMIDAINEKTLDTQIEYGMETQDSVDALKNQWKHYVPLHRDEAHEDNAFGHPIGRGFSVRGSGMKNATGSNAEVTNILAHIAAAREQMLRRGEKNKVTVALAKFIEQNPDKDFAEINKVDFDKKLNEEGLVESQMEPIFKRNQKDNVVMFRVNGKDQAIVFNEKKPETVRLAMSLKNLDGASLDAVESLIAKGTRWMASVNTQYNIIFGIVNLLRDVQGMMLNLSSTELHGKQRKVFNRLGAAMTTIYNEERGKPSRLSSLYERFNKSGGTTGYTQFFDDIRARNKSIEKEFNKLGQNQAFKIGDAALQWLRDYNTLMENATRFAVFMEAVDSGMSDAKAASLAKNITVNFNRKGAQATKVGAFYAFFNASAQGTARLVETMKGPQGKKIAGGGVLLGAITTLLGMMAMGEDEWEKIPEFVRERSIVIPTGGSNYASIPMPLGFHILPNIGRKLVEAAFGSKKVTKSERFLQLVGATANAFNPLGGNDLVDTLSPTVLDPAVALMRNQDWTGRQIYREDFSGLNPTPGFTRKKDSASKASTVAAEFINKATGGTDYKQGYFSPTPDQIDYIFGQFFGGTGREALKLDTTVSSLASGEELPLHKIPLVGRLYGETKGNAVERSAYYENIKRMNEHHAEIKGLSKEPNGTTKVRQYLKENPEASLYVKAKAVQRRIDRLNDQRKILVKAGSKTSTIDNQIAAQMKVLNDAINVKING